MAALDTHPLRSQHLARTLLRFTVCITTLFNGLFRGAGVGGGCGETKQGRKISKSFQYVRDKWVDTGKVCCESDRWYRVKV